jgi:hypothetical protein
MPAKKKQHVKVKDLKPVKDAKGGGRGRGRGQHPQSNQ